MTIAKGADTLGRNGLQRFGLDHRSGICLQGPNGAAVGV